MSQNVVEIDELERIVREEIDANYFKAKQIAEHLEGVTGHQLSSHMLRLEERGIITRWSSEGTSPKTYTRVEDQ